METGINSLDIIIPVFNEENTLDEILKKVDEASFCGLKKHIILIDDGSVDSTREILKKYEDVHELIYHDKNKGKGAAVYTGFCAAKSDIVLIQDADLEYDPNDYEPLISLIVEDKADVVYGTRFSDPKKPSHSSMMSHFWGNKFLTFVTNLLYGCKLTDMETCYKVFKRDFIKDIKIKSKKFDFEPEITAKITKKGARLLEVPISYYGRGHDEGKKITYKDGFAALYALLRFRFFD